MRKIYFLSFFIGCYGLVAAQSYTAETKINKMSKMAVVNEIPFTPDVTDDAVKEDEPVWLFP